MCMQDENEYLKRFGDHLIQLRKVKDLNSSDMARKCLMNRANYARLEKGNKNPSLITLIKISEALGFTMEELFRDFNKGA
jgi:DNA-binding XRE family transcriptional regulator